MLPAMVLVFRHQVRKLGLQERTRLRNQKETNLMKKLLSTLLNHERYQSIAIVLITALLIWTYGCPSKVDSLRSPGNRLTRTEFEIEVTSLLATAEVRLLDLDRQDNIKRLIFDNLLLTAQSGQFNPVGLGMGIATILGIGATVDNVRKRKEIKNLVKT